MTNNFWTAFLLASFSGLSTSIGGAVVLFFGNPSPKTLGHLMSFSCGVMLYISFVDLLADATTMIGLGTSNIFFFLGMILSHIVETMIPEPDISKFISIQDAPHFSQSRNLFKAGITTAVGISMHNFPEGIAVYLSGLKGHLWAHVGLPLAIAIALHNIPEGMAVAVPIYGATKNKWMAFRWCTISGLFEPLGALLAGTLFYAVLTPFVVEASLAVVAGIMVYLCFKELVPTTLQYISPDEAMYSLVTGMFAIFVSVYFVKGYMGLPVSPE